MFMDITKNRLGWGIMNFGLTRTAGKKNNGTYKEKR